MTRRRYLPTFMGMSTPGQSREDLAAALAVRRELGPEYEAELVEGFLDKMDTAIAARVDTQVAERLAATERRSDDSGDSNPTPGVIALASMGLGIPLSGIAGGIGELPGLVVAWLGIVGVNVAYNWGRRRRS